MSAQYFAQLNDENIVIALHVVTAEFIAANPERYTGVWVETFTDNPNKNYAGIGMEYLEAEQDFRNLQPYPSWTWANKVWNPPTPMPTDNQLYRWNEEDLEWVAI
jgi:hypothetical protein